MKKVYIEHSSPEYRALFFALGFKIVESETQADLICFTGGADVSPSLYGADMHPQTWSDVDRDSYEVRLFAWAQSQKVPMVGICRGGQFLNVMSGGAMYQHVSEHGRAHPITDLKTGEVFYVTSTHHQMMKPGIGHELVATSKLYGKREWYEGEVFKKDISEEDIEVVWYSASRCLCFQPHPEMYQGNEGFYPMRTYFRSLLQRYIGV